MENSEPTNTSRDVSDSTDEALEASMEEEHEDEDVKLDQSIRLTVQGDINPMNRDFTAKEDNNESIACDSVDLEMPSFAKVNLPDDIDMTEVPEEEEYDVEKDYRWEIPDWYQESVDKARARKYVLNLVVPIWIACLLFGLIRGDFAFVTTILAGPIMLILGYLFRRKETQE